MQELTKNIDGIDPDSLMKALGVLGRIDIRDMTLARLAQSPDEIVETLGAVKKMKDNAEWHYTWGNIFRQRVMLCERHLNAELINRLEGLARGALKGGSTEQNPSEDWLHRMLECIRTDLECSMEIHLNSATYLPDIQDGIEYVEKPHKRKMDEQTLQVLVADIAIAATRTWFGLSNRYLTEARTNFVNIIMHYYGPGALLLPEVWSVYVNMRNWLCDIEVFNLRRTNMMFAPDQQRTFRHIVAMSAAADHTSKAFLRLHTLKLAYRDLVD